MDTYTFVCRKVAWAIMPVLFFGTSMNLTMAAPPSEQELNESIVQLAQELDRKLAPNQFGVRLTAHEYPSEVLNIVTRLKTLLDSVAGQGYGRPESARNLTVNALEILYRGRGNTSRGDKKGWYTANRSGETGLAEISTILNYGILDEVGRKRFIGFVESYDFNLAENKKLVGFPPAFEIGSSAIQEQVIETAKAAPVAQEPSSSVFGRIKKKLSGITGAQEVGAAAAATATQEPAEMAQPVAAQRQPGEKLKTTNELIDEAISEGKIPDGDGVRLKEFLFGVEANLYDKSVGQLNDPRQRMNYFGRENEMREIVNILSRMEKGHILMTGKAGTGKTTILKMLSDAFVSGKVGIRNEPSPIILELPITTVTNPTDPTAIKRSVTFAKILSQASGRRVILYVDEAHVATPMTRNALKGFLTEMISPLKSDGMVHVIFSTTSQESRTFLSDTAFSRRFGEVHVPEFGRDETIQLIKQAYLKTWQATHAKQGYAFAGIEDGAYEYAYRYGSLEQPHAGNPTGTKELLEGAIVRKLNAGAGRANGSFVLSSQDVQQYIRERLKTPLVPGDPTFEENFAEKWAAFNRDYVGNEGAKAEIRQSLRSHFGTLNHSKMTALAAFGPPGGGKTFAAEMIGKHFFSGAVLTINGAELKNGGTELNKLIGSPTGHIGSEEQRSVLTKFIKDNPGGGVIVIEEADYLHQDVVQFFTNMITNRKFSDGLGMEWDASRFIIQVNSNIGQDHMIPPNSRNQMNWEQFKARRAALTEKVLIEGQEVERVKPEKMASIFDQFIETIVTKSNPNGDTSAVAQEANKQKRRYRATYILPPNRAELVSVARNKVARFIQDTQIDYGVTFEISDETIDRIIDVERYNFEKGYSYILDQLDDKLFGRLTEHLHERGKKFKVQVRDIKIEMNGRQMPGEELVVSAPGRPDTVHRLGVVVSAEANPWGDSPQMMARIRNFSAEMNKHIKGNYQIIQQMKDRLKLKTTDWNTQNVFTLLGTSGNGKTETARALSRVLYGDESALFRISGVTDKYTLANYLRPPMGIQGGKEATEFENWFLARQKAGGGVILFDELLSFAGLGQNEIGHRLEAFNLLYDLLDTGFIRIGNKQYDARAFTVVITGNSLQEKFGGIPNDPGAERVVEKILGGISRAEIVDYFMKRGMDPPKVARLGQIHVLGPLSKAVTQEIGEKQVTELVSEIRARLKRPIQVEIDPLVIRQVVENLSTIELGMREVNRGFDVLVKQPASAILQDIPEIQKLELKRQPDGSVKWFGDGKEVALEGVKIGGSGLEERNWNYLKSFAKGSANRTPQMSDIGATPRLVMSEEALRAVAAHEVYGHWMTSVLLNRTNDSEVISLYAGRKHLGYVQPASDGIYRLSHLTGLLKEAVILNAGHRAVFAQGIYATGGGVGGRRNPNAPLSDDLGRIDQLIETMINNRLIPGVSETSEGKQKALVKQYLMDMIDQATDLILRDGMTSREFEAAFNQAVRDRFLAREELNALVAKVDFKKFGTPEDFMRKNFLGAFAEVNKDWTARGRLEGKWAEDFAGELAARLRTEFEKKVGATEPPRGLGGAIKCRLQGMLNDLLTK